MKKILYIALGAILLGTASCKKYLDVNDNPNATSKVQPGLLFNYAAASFAGERASGDYYIPNALAVQTIASGGNFGWGASNVYDLSVYSIGNMWKTYYSSAGNNLQLAIRQAESATPANPNAAAQSKILLAQLVYETTMLWGDIPYAEAWHTEIPYPHFQPQQVVMDSIVHLLDNAVAQIDPANAQAIIDQDLFYKGNLNSWRRFAKSLKFKVLMTMVDKDPSKAAEIGQLLNEGDMVNAASQNLQFPFFTTPLNQNPKFRILDEFAGGQNIFFFANETVLDPMKAQDDPRIPKYFDKPDAATDYNSVPSEVDADETTATISLYLYRADAPELIFSYQEQLFLEAEAYARGIGVPRDLATANTKYKAALAAACKYYGVDDADITAFVATKDLTAVPDAVAEIHLQQWIDLMDRPGDAFANWRRSGPAGAEVPALSVPPGAPNNGLFRRWPYPNAEEVSPNPNAPKNNPQYFEKLWFDL